MVIRLFKLEGCETCKMVEEHLKKFNVSLIIQNPRSPQDTKVCKDLDLIFECNLYPKLVLETKDNIVYIVPAMCKKIEPIGNNLFFYWTTIDSIDKIINQFYEK